MLLAVACGALTPAAGQAPPPGPDADGDGVPVPYDCNDANPAISPVAQDVPGNGVDEDCSGADATPQRVGSKPHLFWRARTKVIARAWVERIPAASTVVLRCEGRSCSVRTAARRVESPTRVIDFRAIRGMRARPGTLISLLVSNPRKAGIVASYRFRRNGDVVEHVCSVPPGVLEKDC